jgi:deoxyribonuclease-4
LVPERAAAIGAEVVQIFNSNARQWRVQARTPEEVAALVDGLRRLGLPLFFHSIYLINLATADKDLRRRSVEALTAVLALAGATGARGIVTHIGSRHHLSFADATRRIDASVRAAHQAAGRWSGNPGNPGSPEEPASLASPGGREPRLLLETSPGSGTTVGGRLEELEALLGLLPSSCGICLDTAHLFASGYPVHTEAGLQEVVQELRARNLLSRVGLIHLNDSKTPLGCSCDRHENLGDGLIGSEGLRRMVRHEAFRHIPFVLEVPGLDGKGPDAVNLKRAKSMRRGACGPPNRPVRPA